MRREAAAELLAQAFSAPIPPYVFGSRVHDVHERSFSPMRSIAVAADGGGLSEVPPGAIAGISTAVGAAIGGIALSLAQRYAGKAAWQQALNAGFKDLLDQVQKERERERQEHEADRLAWRQERIEYRGRITNLELTVRSLKDRMHQGGLLEDVRPDRYSPDPIITLTGDDD